MAINRSQGKENMAYPRIVNLLKFLTSAALVLMFSFLEVTPQKSVSVPRALARRRGRRRRRRRKKQRKRKKGAGNRQRATRGEPATKALMDGEWHFNECLKVPRNKKVSFNLEPEATIHDLVAWISSLTCKKFIVGSNIRAQKATIYSPTPVTPRGAYRAFVSALNVMGLTVRPAGKYLKVVQSSTKGLSSVCLPGGSCPKDERIVTRLVRLKYVAPDDVKAVLDGLKSKDGNIITYDPTALLIITDAAKVTHRLVRVIEQLDEKTEGNSIWILRIKNAVASEIAERLSEVFDVDGNKASKKRTRRGRRRRRRKRRRPKAPAKKGTSGDEGPGGVDISNLLADDRTNLLVMVADEESYRRAKALIKKLDIDVNGGKERVHVVPLANADAEELRDTLSGLTGGGGGRAARRRGRRGKKRQSRQRRGGAGTVGLFQGEVQITADASTNSLILVASMKDYLSLQRIIDELDTPRRQVFVEASILEVSISKTRELGFAFHGGAPVGSGDDKSLLLFGNNASKSITLDPASLMGMAVGLRGPELKDAESLLGIPGISFPTFGAFFTALQSDNDVNVISQPHILTTDNEEAVIEVGENVPFQSGISGMGNLGALMGQTGGSAEQSAGQSTALSALPMMSVQRQDVTLKLKITPYVNDSNQVRLEIEQEMNEVKSIDPSVGPTTSKKKVQTTIVVKDQQTAVLGGLITEKTKKNVTKVPLLGDIPVLGYLFKDTTTVKEKSNLLVFLTPYIIRDQSDLRRIFQRKIKKRREFLERYTLFEDYEIEEEINYRHTRGLLAEIDRVARMAEEDEAMRQKAIKESKFKDIDGPVLMQKR